MKAGNGIQRANAKKCRGHSFKALIHCALFLITCEGIEPGNQKIWSSLEMSRIEEKERTDGVRHMNVVHLENEDSHSIVSIFWVNQKPRLSLFGRIKEYGGQGV